MTGFFKSLAAGLVATGIWEAGVVALKLIAGTLALGGLWMLWLWGRKWLQRRKERKGREFRARVECCVREVVRDVLREMGAEDAIRNREVETLPSSPDKIWRVRGYRGGDVLEEKWYADREEAKQAGRRLLEWDNFPDPDGRPPFERMNVVNAKTGDVALSLAAWWV